ncbi:hypothetical protein PGTUg99_017332 [Puccinia graminis f. sp. tritici]|uniref:EF-hand domain-containing protein n=1 Tax=Puccinia graminis f. sp. tritici TaxID=56615 RepID=A0A5B0RWZ1_PUCGR|nr:hypothetical protein PGTUg99_017332 [Puccinia graminis f. sp. tritici]
MNPNLMLKIFILTGSTLIEGIKAPIGSSYGKNLVESKNAFIKSVQGSKQNDGMTLDLLGKIDSDHGIYSGKVQQERKKRKLEGTKNSEMDLGLSLSVQQGSNVSNIHESRKVKLETDSREILKCGSKSLTGIENWKKDFQELELDHQTKFQIEYHIEFVINSLKKMFQEGTPEDNDQNKVFNKGKGVSDMTTWLSSIFSVEKMMDISRIPDVLQARSIIHKWFELMMNVCVEIQQQKIITQEYFSHLLNKDEKVQYFIMNYVKTKFYPYDIGAVYVNFNQKLSLLEDASMKENVIIFKSLDQDTWGKIEFQYVETCLERYLSTTEYPTKEFMKLRRSFLELKSTDRKENNLKQITEMFFVELINFISSQMSFEDVHINDEKLLELKILYDMYRFVLKYKKHDLPSQIMEAFQEEVQHEVRIFEATIILLGSIFHCIYIRSKEFVQKVTQEANQFNQDIPSLIVELCKSSRYISDSNQKREIPKLDALSEKEKVLLVKLNSIGYQVYHSCVLGQMKSSIPLKSKDIQDSIMRCALIFKCVAEQFVVFDAYKHDSYDLHLPQNVPSLSKNSYRMAFQKVRDFDASISLQLRKYKYSFN